jgi:gas vesicle protein
MGQSPEELRENIARTRDDLSGTIDAIEDRVSPSRIVERRKESVRTRWTGMKESVMGSADDLRQTGAGMRDQIGDQASNLGDRVSSAPETARRKAQGSPFGVGLIAFGAGMLAAAIFPGTETEGQLALRVQEMAQPVTEQVKQAGQQVVADLREPAQQAAQELKESASSHAQDLKETAQQATEDTRQAASEGASQVTDQARQSAQTVRQQS